jgi:GntR family transcriptional repressor for pyruvate dehydrogenase complex
MSSIIDFAGLTRPAGYRDNVKSDPRAPEANETDHATQPRRRNRKTSELVAQDIVKDIRARGLSAGEMLPAETVMLEQYGVGRASVREALRILELHGLIRMKPGPGGGPVVGTATPADFGRMATLHFQAGGTTIRELVEARLIMEPLLARLAAERQSPERLAELRSIVDQPLDTADNSVYLANAHGFHVAIANSSGNGVLDLFAVAVHDIFVERIHGALYSEGRGEVHKDHLAIASAIFAGEGSKAETLMRRHMEEFSQFVAVRHPALLEEVIDWS